MRQMISPKTPSYLKFRFFNLLSIKNDICYICTLGVKPLASKFKAQKYINDEISPCFCRKSDFTLVSMVFTCRGTLRGACVQNTISQKRKSKHQNVQKAPTFKRLTMSKLKSAKSESMSSPNSSSCPSALHWKHTSKVNSSIFKVCVQLNQFNLRR